jgi:hypothetical protein
MVSQGLRMRDYVDRMPMLTSIVRKVGIRKTKDAMVLCLIVTACILVIIYMKLG